LPDRPGTSIGERVNATGGQWVWADEAHQFVWNGWVWEPFVWTETTRIYKGDFPQSLEIKITELNTGVEYDHIFIDVNFRDPKYFYSNELKTFIETNPVLKERFGDGRYLIEARFWDGDPSKGLAHLAPGQWSSMILNVDQPWWGDQDWWGRDAGNELVWYSDVMREDITETEYFVGLQNLPFVQGVEYFELTVDPSGSGFTENQKDWQSYNVSSGQKIWTLPINNKSYLTKEGDNWVGKYSFRVRAVRERDTHDPHDTWNFVTSEWFYSRRQVSIPDSLFTNESEEDQIFQNYLNPSPVRYMLQTMQEKDNKTVITQTRYLVQGQDSFMEQREEYELLNDGNWKFLGAYYYDEQKMAKALFDVTVGDVRKDVFRYTDMNLSRLNSLPDDIKAKVQQLISEKLSVYPDTTKITVS
jgi:hypothetical protein